MTAAGLDAHLKGGATTVCRAWTLRRRDGVELGFTDHDRALEVEGVLCKADAGLTARALQQSTGLSVDNSEAFGALSHEAIREADLAAGRFDGAEVRVWLVNWSAPEERAELFRGTLGEVVRKGAEFRAELRGLSEPLNQVTGFAYTRTCSAVLGDARCRFDLTQPGYVTARAVERIDTDQRMLEFSDLAGFDPRWFEHGRLDVLSGEGAGLWAMIRGDRPEGSTRRIDLWQSIRAPLRRGDRVRLTAGCDKRADTCRAKFANFLNFRGFPHIPGEDWLTAYPRPGQPAQGGSLISSTGTGPLG